MDYRINVANGYLPKIKIIDFGIIETKQFNTKYDFYKYTSLISYEILNHVYVNDSFNEKLFKFKTMKLNYIEQTIKNDIIELSNANKSKDIKFYKMNFEYINNDFNDRIKILNDEIFSEDNLNLSQIDDLLELLEKDYRLIVPAEITGSFIGKILNIDLDKCNVEIIKNQRYVRVELSDENKQLFIYLLSTKDINESIKFDISISNEGGISIIETF